MKKLILKGLAALSSLILVACASSQTSKDTSSDLWTSYESSKSITIGFDNTFVPMGFEDSSGDYVGFDIDLANAVFDQYGISVTWQPINWDLKETELANGNIDLIWNGYSMTEERAQKVLFSDAYMSSTDVLVTKKSSGITDFAGMADKVLGTQSGSSSYDNFVNNPSILKDIVKDQDATQYETYTQALIDLENGRIDGLLIDKVYASYYLEQAGKLSDYNLITSELTSSQDDFAVGARKADTTLISKINEAFTSLYQSGKFQEISDKWFGQDVATDAVKN